MVRGHSHTSFVLSVCSSLGHLLFTSAVTYIRKASLVQITFIVDADLSHTTLHALVSPGYLDIRHVTYDSKLPGNNKSARFV